VPTENPFASGDVRGVLHRPAQPNGAALALTHGAGSNCHAPLLAKIARLFCEAGYLVLRYDLPFRQQRPKGPPFPAGAARDREGVAQAVAEIRTLAAGPVLAGGHSYGGRQTAMLAAEKPALADALLLLSYPLHPPAKPEQKRTSFFPNLHVPAVFVQGVDDGFGTPEEMRAALALIPCPTSLLLAERSGHELKNGPALFPQIEAALRGLTGRRAV
jgi:hypothetical protein